VQLISDPAVLFLDEPTSGLDSFQALSVMESMRDLARNGRLVISVIHQPRSSIFNMFDRLLLLSEGRAMYSGLASEAVDYFNSTGFRCHDFFNPADYFLDILSPDNRSHELEVESAARIQRLGDEWVYRGDHYSMRERPASPDGAQVQANGDVRSVGSSSDMNKVVRNLKILAWRALVEQSRDVGMLIFKMVFVCFFGLIIGGIYSNIGFTQTSIQNRNGVLYFISIQVAFNNLVGVLNTFPREKIIVNRERSNRAYDTFSYFFAKFIVEIPLNALPALLYCCIVYW
jgi:energy-coupling factor transporter ATP-binding protein EcfA2